MSRTGVEAKPPWSHVPPPVRRGGAPETFVSDYERSRSIRREVLPAIIAGFAGYFIGVAWQPPRPELPRLRDVQRLQMRACIPWAARALDLPYPDWIDAVRD